MKARRVLVMLGLLFMATQAFAAVDYYVDSQNGNDGNSGISPAEAWRTIGNVNARWGMIGLGDDILFKRGCVFTDETLYVRRGGTSANPMIIGAYGEGEKPVVDGQANSLGGGVVCAADGLSYVHIQDLAVRNMVSTSGIAVAGTGISNITISRVDVANVANNGIGMAKVNTYTIQDCHISNCVNSGIAIVGSATSRITNGLIQNNVIHDIAENDGITLHISSAYGEEVGPNHLLVNNTCYNCFEQGFDITSGTQITMVRNETYNNGDSGILIGNVWDVKVLRHFSHGDLKMGIIVGKVERLRIEDSIIFNAHNHQITLGNCKDVKLFNNTFVHGPNSTDSIIDLSGTASTIVFKNNIVTSTQFAKPDRYVRFLGGLTPASVQCDLSNNLWWRPDNGAADDRLFYDAVTGLQNYYGWTSSYGMDQGGSFTDPRLTLPGQGDFRLLAGSPAIDAALDVGSSTDFPGTPVPQGIASDIGAYEYASSGELAVTAQANPASGPGPLLVNFIGSASGGTGPYSYAWDFGDGSTSSAQNAQHTYSAEGEYTATLTATDGAGDSAATTLAISVLDPQSSLAASLTATVASGTAPLNVAFSGCASGGTGPYAYNWTFGDGQTATGIAASHTFTSGGSYTVVFAATDATGATALSTTVITVQTALSSFPVSAFASKLSGRAPFNVKFLAAVKGGASPYTYSWNFGDGEVSLVNTPSHTFSKPGIYTVTLSVQDSKGATGSASLTITTKDKPRADLRVSPANFSVVSAVSPDDIQSQTLPVKAGMLTITRTGPLARLRWTLSSDQNWVGFSRISGVGTSYVRVLFDTTSLLPGTYTAVIYISAPDALHPTQAIPVSLTIKSATP